MSIPATIDRSIVRGHAVTDVLLVIGGSAIIAIAAQIAIPVPFTPVPLTMQPLAVLLVGIALGARRGAAAAALYLIEGASGLPVFAQGHGGALWLASYTGGYLLSYPFAAFVAGWFSQRGWGGTILRSVAGMLIALAIIYVFGWSWLAMFVGARDAWIMGILPFIVVDVVKVAIGAALIPSAEKLIARL